MSIGRKILYIMTGIAIATTLTALFMWGFTASGRDQGEGFAAYVDLSPLDGVAVHVTGRFKSFDAFASEHMSYITGSRSIDDQSDAFTYLDLLLRPGHYQGKPLIYIKKDQMRAELAQALQAAGVAEPAMAQFVDSGLISRELLQSSAAIAVRAEWSQDLLRTAKYAEQLNTAISVSDPQLMLSRLRLIPPPSGDSTTAWLTLGEFLQAGAADPAAAQQLADMNPQLRRKLSEAFTGMIQAWTSPDALSHDPARQQQAGALTSAAVAQAALLLPQVNPEVYPDADRLRWESFYFELGSLTWIWLIYLFAVIFLLMGVAYRWQGPRLIGLGIFGSAFALHTAALLLRWWISGRWPNSNMFEAVTTSVWFGTLLAVVIEVAARRTSLRSLFALTASVASMAALMAANFAPQLDADISNMMPVLHDIWLYIHTNVIIASYALIAMASVTALLYLLRRLIGGSADYARVGGTGMLLAAAGEKSLPGRNGRTSRSLGEILDGATLVLMELSFVMLWSGIAMGAIWADHSWGRPWGWDPKEVFALNTFLVFVILIHTRMKVRDKGLWTAILAVVGCGVMLFNWIVINFVISGLHSYA